MWQHWLGATPFESFRTSHLQQLPLARPSTVAEPRSLLDWDVLGAVVAADPPPDVLVVAGGEILPFPPPRSIDEVRAYLRIGVGFCLRGTERCHPVLAGLADEMASDLLGAVHVQLFVTPGGTHGFGWHYDDEHVFIAQTAGRKQYYFRANTVAAGVPADATAFGCYTRETSTLCTATLIEGDFLYLPSRWWHMAVCEETSLSVSVGVLPRAA